MNAPWLYGLSITVALLGLGLADFRYRLALFCRPRRTIVTLLCGMVCFSLLDLLNIARGVFRYGYSHLASGRLLYRDFPVEELGFLLLLNYTALLLWRFGNRHVRLSADQ